MAVVSRFDGGEGLPPSASISVPWPANRPQGRARRPRETSSQSGRAALTPLRWPWCALQKQMQGMMWKQRSSLFAIDLLLQRTSFLLHGVKTLRRAGDEAGHGVSSNVLRPGRRNERLKPANEAVSTVTFQRAAIPRALPPPPPGHGRSGAAAPARRCPAHACPAPSPGWCQAADGNVAQTPPG